MAFFAFLWVEVADPNVNQDVSVLVEADCFKLETLFVLKFLVLGAHSLSQVLMEIDIDCYSCVLHP